MGIFSFGTLMTKVGLKIVCMNNLLRGTQPHLPYKIQCRLCADVRSNQVRLLNAPFSTYIVVQTALNYIGRDLYFEVESNDGKFNCWKKHTD